MIPTGWLGFGKNYRGSQKMNKDDLQSRLEDLEDVTFDEERDEIEDIIDSGGLDDAEGLIDDLESERA